MPDSTLNPYQQALVGAAQSFYNANTSPKVDPGIARPNLPDESNRPTSSTALNIGALLALADTEPERNPRNMGGEVLANLYREVGRLKGRVSYLEQNS